MPGRSRIDVPGALQNIEVYDEKADSCLDMGQSALVTAVFFQKKNANKTKGKTGSELLGGISGIIYPDKFPVAFKSYLRQFVWPEIGRLGGVIAGLKNTGITFNKVTDHEDRPVLFVMIRGNPKEHVYPA